jgi:poly(A)-specific ribonuclease
VVNLYRCFIGDLPEDVGEFRAKLNEMFPLVIDTKYMATMNMMRWADTSLHAVEADLNSEGKPRIDLPIDFEQELNASTYHEAGFDSFVTAKIGLKLAARLKREGKDLKQLMEHAPTLLRKAPATIDDSKHENAPDRTIKPTDKKPRLTKTVVEAIKSPLTVVKSLSNSTEVGDQKSAMHSDTAMEPSAEPEKISPVVAVKETVTKPSVSKAQLKTVKLRGMSQKSNIFDMLEDEPTEPPEGSSEEEERVKEQKRVTNMLRNGDLIPRWDEDAEFWDLVGNKLQVNSCEEGVFALSQANAKKMHI